MKKILTIAIYLFIIGASAYYDGDSTLYHSDGTTSQTSDGQNFYPSIIR